MKRIVISLFVLATTGVLQAKSAELNQHNPNVLLIFTDDLGYGDVSFFNEDSKINTPNLDKLAKQGVVFADAHASSSVCTPSRYGLLTGEYSWKSKLKAGVLKGFSPELIPQDKPTIATILQEQGYATSCIGKWHLGMNFQTQNGQPLVGRQYATGENVDYTKPIKHSPISHGFDYYYGIAASLDMPPFLMIENDTLVKQPNCRLTIKQYTDFDDAVSANPFLRDGDAVFGEGPETFLPRLNAKVQEKMTQSSKTKNPFFIYYAMPAPHAPIAPSKQFQGHSKIGAYGDYVEEVDYYVGELIKTLKRNKQYDNTLIIFSSDNGPEYYAYKRFLATGHRSAGIYKGIKRDIWEGGHRVPLIVSWKAGFRHCDGTVVQHAVCLSDIYATLANITGHKMQLNEAADSYSLLPLMRKEETSYARDYVIHHSSDGRFAVRKGDWVLIDYCLGDANHKIHNPISAEGEYYKALNYTFPTYQPGNGELYNLKDDPEERNDVYAQHPDLVKELRGYISKATRDYHTKFDSYNLKRDEKVIVK